MSLLKRLFKNSIKERKESKQDKPRGKFMPEPEIPIDDKFLTNFKNNGGKFIYCTEENEIQENFKNILTENNWEGDASCFDQELQDKFDHFGLNFTRDLNAPFLLLRCEFLIAGLGGILLSSNQIREKNIRELPYNIVVLAGTSQLVDNIGEGMARINGRRHPLPTNISIIKKFGDQSGVEGHFLNYGYSSKNLYLLLLEDL